MIEFSDALYSDPSLAPFLPERKKDEVNNDEKKERKGKNTLPIGSSFPKSSAEKYLDIWNKMLEYAVTYSEDANDVGRDAKQLYAMIRRLYKMFNHKPITATGGIGNESAVICQLALITLKDSSFNTVLLGGNINEYAYYSAARNNVGTIFTGNQSVQYKGGENGRRKDIGEMYRVLIDKVYQFTNKYLTDFTQGGNS